MKKLLLIAFIITSCSPLYIPNSRNSPMFTKAGEFQVSAHVVNGLEVQSAVSVTKHIGLMANSSYANESSPFSAFPEQRHKFFEGGAGYFANKKEMHYEIFAGYGRGEAFVHRKGGRYERFFLQPAIGTTHKRIQISFASRITAVNFLYFFTGNFTDSASQLPETKTKFLIEPALITRVNILQNRAFFTFQLSSCQSVSENLFFKKSNLQISYGLGFRLGALRKRNEQE